MAVLDELFRADDKNVVKIRFGGGESSTASPLDIDTNECASGQNFDLRLDSLAFKSRAPFDDVGTVPNASAIRGFAELIKQDGTVHFLVQAADTVYEWDGDATFTSVGTVDSNARLRGNRASTDLVNEKVLIGDFEKREVVKTYDGTTFEDLDHNLEGEFRAKYIIVDNERAHYGNVFNNVDLSHILVGSKRGDVATLSVSDRPSSALNDEDPWFLPTHDLRPINAVKLAFGQILLSTGVGDAGEVNLISGETAQNFAVDDLFADSGASGENAVAVIGNDVLWGRTGKVESLLGIQAFGDVATDDASRWISEAIENVKEWEIIYNKRNSKLYCWPADGNEIWVFNKDLFQPSARFQIAAGLPPIAGLSPWSKWKTDFGSGNFQNTAAAIMRHPQTKIDDIFFGDSSGNLYRMEGAGTQDGGTTDITSSRISPTIRPPIGGVYDVKWTLFYKKDTALTASVTLTFQFGGVEQKDETITRTLPGFTSQPFYAGGSYYNNDEYYRAEFTGRLQFQQGDIPGRSGFFQVKVEFTGQAEAHELHLEFRARKTKG